VTRVTVPIWRADAQATKPIERAAPLSLFAAMTGLKLYGMRANFDEIAGKGLNRRKELYPLLASLIRAEVTHR
jgi:hypothetical protein